MVSGSVSMTVEWNSCGAGLAQKSKTTVSSTPFIAPPSISLLGLTYFPMSCPGGEHPPAARFQYWARGHPGAWFHSMRDCVRMDRGAGWRWKETACSGLKWHYRFICMYPKAPTPSQPDAEASFQDPTRTTSRPQSSTSTSKATSTFKPTTPLINQKWKKVSYKFQSENQQKIEDTPKSLRGEILGVLSALCSLPIDSSLPFSAHMGEEQEEASSSNGKPQITHNPLFSYLTSPDHLYFSDDHPGMWFINDHSSDFAGGSPAVQEVSYLLSITESTRSSFAFIFSQALKEGQGSGRDWSACSISSEVW